MLPMGTFINPVSRLAFTKTFCCVSCCMSVVPPYALCTNLALLCSLCDCGCESLANLHICCYCYQFGKNAALTRDHAFDLAIHTEAARLFLKRSGKPDMDRLTAAPVLIPGLDEGMPGTGQRDMDEAVKEARSLLFAHVNQGNELFFEDGEEGESEDAPKKDPSQGKQAVDLRIQPAAGGPSGAAAAAAGAPGSQMEMVAMQSHGAPAHNASAGAAAAAAPGGYPPHTGYPPQHAYSPQHGYPPQQGYPPQGYPRPQHAGYPPAAAGIPAGYPAPYGYPPQGYPPQGYAPQPQPGYPPQQGYAFPPQGYPPQGYPPQGYPPQGYPPQPGQGYPPAGYPMQGAPAQQYGAAAPPPPGYPGPPTASPTQMPAGDVAYVPGAPYGSPSA